MPFVTEEAIELAVLMKQAGLTELEIRDGDLLIRMSHPSVPAEHGTAFTTPPEKQPQAAPSIQVITSPAVGLFRAIKRQSDHSALATTKVTEGELIGLVRVGMLYRPVNASGVGRLATLVADDALVGYGTPLFELHRD